MLPVPPIGGEGRCHLGDNPLLGPVRACFVAEGLLVGACRLACLLPNVLVHDLAGSQVPGQGIGASSRRHAAWTYLSAHVRHAVRAAGGAASQEAPQNRIHLRETRGRARCP